MSNKIPAQRTRRILHCTSCARELKMCNASPCSGKLNRQQQNVHGRKAVVRPNKNVHPAKQQNRNQQRAPKPIIRMKIETTEPENKRPPWGGYKEDSEPRVPYDIESELAQLVEHMVINDTTGQPQMDLIYFLNSAKQLLGKSHWVVVTGYDVHGMLVEMVVETPFQRWRLHDLRILWFDFPWEVSSWCLEKRMALSRARMPIGSSFKAKVMEITDAMMRLAPSKYANPVLKLTNSFMPLVPAKCPFRYLIALDLEATCDYCPEPKVNSRTAEIIEFPWVVIDTKTLKIIDEQQIYVKPDNMDGITYYATKLTGIAKNTVLEAPNLASAVKQFDEYVKRKFGNSTSFRIVTDGIWDLQVQMRTEAAKKNIELAWYFSDYFDLKDEFRKFFPWFPESFRPRLDGVLKALGLEFVGKPHVGLDDSRNIAKIVQRMLALGHLFNTPNVIPADYDPYTDPKFVDFGSVTETGSWKCCEAECGVWNRPWMNQCRFCPCTKEHSNVLHIEGDAAYPPAYTSPHTPTRMKHYYTDLITNYTTPVPHASPPAAAHPSPPQPWNVPHHTHFSAAPKQNNFNSYYIPKSPNTSPPAQFSPQPKMFKNSKTTQPINTSPIAFRPQSLINTNTNNNTSTKCLT